MDIIINALPKLLTATGETLGFLAVAMLIGGFCGLIIGVLLVTTRKGGLLQNGPTYVILNVLVNFFRPIPFVVLILALQPLARLVVGTGLENKGVMFFLSFAATFGIARLVEQNLRTVDPGVIEAARSMGAGPLRIITTVLLPEGLGPLVLGFTFAFIAVVDMSAIASIIGGGGLGAFALTEGFRQFKPELTWTAVILLVLIVQLAQIAGNFISRKLMRR